MKVKGWIFKDEQWTMNWKACVSFGDKVTDLLTDICDHRVAFATENIQTGVDAFTARLWQTFTINYHI